MQWIWTVNVTYGRDDIYSVRMSKVLHLVGSLYNIDLRCTETQTYNCRLSTALKLIKPVSKKSSDEVSGIRELK